MIIGIIIAFVFIVGWLALWISMWVKGAREKRPVLLILAAFFTLSILGLIIGIIVVSSWNNGLNGENSNKMVAFREEELKLQREKLELEKKKQQTGK